MHYDLIIVGAGPAGVSTALYLLHARPELHERIIVLERKTFPREKVCAGALGARGDRLLRRIGVEVDVPSVSVSTIRLSVPRRWTNSTPGDIGRVVRRSEFDARLVEIARERGVRIRENSRVTDVQASADGVEVAVGNETLTAGALVGADGVGSLVRRRLGLPFGRFKARAIEVDTDWTEADLGKDTLHFDLSDRALCGYAWDFPTPLDGRIQVSRGVYCLELPRAPMVDVESYLRARLARLGLNLDEFRVRRMAERGFDPHQPFSSRRVILVGEAAGVDPLTGEGIAEAIGYGALAGPYLARRLELGDLGFSDWRTHFLRSPLGADLLFRRGAASFCFQHARRAAEVLLARIPGTLSLATGLFAGRLPYWSRSEVTTSS